MLSSVPPRRLCPCPLLSSSSLLLLHSPFKRSFVVRGGAKQASLVARKFGRPASAKKNCGFWSVWLLWYKFKIQKSKQTHT
jgi:hypothetical protein